MKPFRSRKNRLLLANVLFAAACSTSTTTEVLVEGNQVGDDGGSSGSGKGGDKSARGGVSSVASSGSTNHAGGTTSTSGQTHSGGTTSTSGQTHSGGTTSTSGQTHSGGTASSGAGSTVQVGGQTHVGGGTSSGGTLGTGGSGSCGTRDCRSSKDNDCDGEADSSEAQCECPTPNESVSCNTGLLGICATGKKICTFATDNSSSTWSACIGGSALTRNCSSNIDNNCDGTADNLEPSCLECGKSSPRACDTHPGYDGIGPCRAGVQTLNVASDNSQCSWSECEGAVPPTALEACGPTAPDTNCNNIRGDGPSCGITPINIYSFNASTACSCSSSSSFKSYYAGTSSPGAGWSVISSFKVFTGPQPAGTVAVVNQTNGPLKYVTLASSYSASEVVGFVSTSQPGNYLPLKTTSLTVPCSSTEVTKVLLGTGAGGTPSYYAVP